jgi:hypothetical protein
MCELKSFGIDRGKIQITAGGEDIASVRGRSEDGEFPTYETNAVFMSGPLPTGG